MRECVDCKGDVSSAPLWTWLVQMKGLKRAVAEYEVLGSAEEMPMASILRHLLHISLL